VEIYLAWKADDYVSTSSDSIIPAIPDRHTTSPNLGISRDRNVVMILEPGLRKLRKMRETRRRPGSTSPSVFALLCLISCAQLSAAHEDQGLGVSRKIDDQVDGELKTRVEKVEIGGKLDGEMGDAYITRSSSREIESQFVDDQSSLQTNRRSQVINLSSSIALDLIIVFF
jgi:hypothetical protein